MVRELFDQPGHYLFGLFFFVQIFIKNFGDTLLMHSPDLISLK